MNIAVCIKQVPDTSDLQIDPETNTLIREGVAAVVNPLDEFSIEAGLRLRDQTGGCVTAFTMGPPQARRVLEEAVARGADRSVLVSDRAFAGADTWATSLVLAKALEEFGPFNLILCGKQAVDGDTAQVGPGIAAHLRIPQVTYATRIKPSPVAGWLEVDRLLEHGTARLRVKAPVVVTVLKEANEPRLPTLTGRLRALRVNHESADLARLGLSADNVGLSGSPTRVIRIAVPEQHRQRTRLIGTPPEMAGALLAELHERGLIQKTEAERNG